MHIRKRDLVCLFLSIRLIGSQSELAKRSTWSLTTKLADQGRLDHCGGGNDFQWLAVFLGSNICLAKFVKNCTTCRLANPTRNPTPRDANFAAMVSQPAVGSTPRIVKTPPRAKEKTMSERAAPLTA